MITLVKIEAVIPTRKDVKLQKSFNPSSYLYKKILKIVLTEKKFNK